MDIVVWMARRQNGSARTHLRTRPSPTVPCGSREIALSGSYRDDTRKIAILLDDGKVRLDSIAEARAFEIADALRRQGLPTS